VLFVLAGAVALAQAVYVCDGGEYGTSFEPTGNDQNTGLMQEGFPDPVLTLKRAEEILESKPEGTDLLLCEGGVWHDQTLTVRLSGLPSNRTVVGCYTINEGVLKLCAETYPICSNGIKTKCVDPLDFSLRSSAG
jgi:hypothetical protein